MESGNAKGIFWLLASAGFPGGARISTVTDLKDTNRGHGVS